MRKFYVTLFVLAALTLVNIVQAQPSEKIIKRGITNYLAALQKGNVGLAESAVLNLMKMKLHYPDLDYSKCIKELNKLSDSSPNKVIRLEAYIAANYIKNPQHFNWINEGEYEEITNFFEKYRFLLAYQVEKTNQDVLVGSK